MAAVFLYNQNPGMGVLLRYYFLLQAKIDLYNLYVATCTSELATWLKNV